MAMKLHVVHNTSTSASKPAWKTLITGVVGASYSTVTEEVSTVLQTFNISMLSYAATSTELSKKKRHPLFARLLPSDDRQASQLFSVTEHPG